MRFHELAKELGFESKVLIKNLSSEGISVKSHMSTITDEEAKAVRKVAAGLLKAKNGAGGGKIETEKPAAKKKTVKKKTPKKKVEPEPEPEEKVFLVKKTPAQPPKPPEQTVIEKPETEKPAAKKKTKKEEPSEVSEPGKEPAEVQKKKAAEEEKIEVVSEPEELSAEEPAAAKEEVETEEEVQEEKVLEIEFPVGVKTLADKMNVKPNIVISKLMNYGVFATITQKLDEETASIVGHELGFSLRRKGSPRPKVEEKVEEEIVEIEEPPLPFETPDDPAELKGRAPIVTILGHVDHGKTSLLDKIREANVAAREKGGITQHIGAYRVVKDGKPITFIDTPGHEAFTSMRARGASVTDIAILVVAADDGIMPQTDEAIDHARAANVPIIVAINKIDLPGVTSDQIKRQLSERNLLTEDWGGDVIAVEVSAKTGKGIDSLLEMILLQAEMMELKANPNRLAYGTVIESKLTQGRGVVATVLNRKGTLRVGDPIVADQFTGKVKAMVNDLGDNLKEAAPSVPVEVLGLNGVPDAGADFFVCSSEKEAKQISEFRRLKQKQLSHKRHENVTLEDIFDKIASGQAKTLNLIVKTDAHGSLEALKKSLQNIPSEKVAAKVIHGGTGDVSESDVMLASASGAVIIGFHVKMDSKVKDIAKKEGVEIRLYDIIYRVIEDVRKAMEGLLEPTFKEVVIGKAQVRQCFKISKAGTVAGCYVTDGQIRRQAKVRLMREDEVLYQGDIASLKRFKDEVKEVKSGFECGIRLADFNDVQENDMIEAYVLEKEESLL